MIILSLCTQSCLHRLGYTAIWCYVMVTLPQQTTLTPGLCCRLTFLVIFLVSKLSPHFLFPSPAAGAADVLSDAANGGVFLYWPWCWCCWNPYIQEKATGSRFLRDYTQAHVHICILSGYHSSRIWLAPRCGAPFEWTRVPERGTHWYHGRRGGANRVLLNIKHMTAPPFFFPCLTIKGCLMTCKKQRSVHKQRRVQSRPSACCCCCCPMIHQVKNQPHGGLFLWIPHALSSINKAPWYSDYLCMKIQAEIRSTPLQQTSALK